MIPVLSSNGFFNSIPWSIKTLKILQKKYSKWLGGTEKVLIFAAHFTGVHRERYREEGRYQEL